MYFLNKQFCQLIETKTACSFDENYFVVKLLKNITVYQFFYAFKEIFRFHTNAMGMRLKVFSYTDELLNTTLLTEHSYLLIEFIGGHSALIDVTEDKRMTASLMVGTAVHEVKCDVKRVDIRVIAVVNERTTMLSLLYFKAHGYRFKLLHAFIEHVNPDT